MLAGITTGLSSVITMCGDVVTAIFSEAGALADVTPLIYIGIAMGVIGFGIKTIKSLAWGF